MSQDPPVDKPMKYVSPAWRVMADGYLLDLKPHLHDGGINMTFLVNGKNVSSSSQAESTEALTVDCLSVDKSEFSIEPKAGWS